MKHINKNYRIIILSTIKDKNQDTISCCIMNIEQTSKNIFTYIKIKHYKL